MLRYLDVDNKVLLASPWTGDLLRHLSFTMGDKLIIDLVPLRKTGRADPLYEPVDWTGKTIDFGIFRPGAIPDSGHYQVTYGGKSTDALTGKPIGAQSGQMALTDALNGLSTIADAGGVQIIRGGTGRALATDYEIHFQKAGARTAFTWTDLGLVPEAEVAFQVLHTGTSTERHVVGVSLLQKAMVHSTSFTAQTTTALSLSTTQAGDGSTKEVQQIELTPAPLGGKWQPTVDGTELDRIPWNATDADWQRALSAKSKTDVTAEQVAQSKWSLFWKETGDQPDTTADLTGLTKPNIYRATIDIDSAVIDADTVGAPPVLTIQVSAAGDASRETVFNGPVILAMDTLNNQTT